MVDFKAVSDLATFSPATDGYLNRPGDLEKMYGIPVHAIVTDGALDPSQVVQTEENIINKILVFLVKIGFFGINKALEDHNDFVVSVKSQKGGLDDAYTSIIHNQMHVGSPDNSFVQDTLMSLLHESVSSQRFCLTGFRPDNMTLARRQHDSQPDVAKARRRAPALPPVVTASVSNNKLTASMSGAEGYDHQMMIAQFGRDAYCMVSGSELECEVPSSFSGEIAIYGIARMEGEDALWHNTTIAVEAPRTSRASISASDLTLYYGEPQSVSLTCTWSDGSITRVTPDDVTFTDNKAVYADGRITGVHGGSGTATFTYQGLTCTAPFTVYNFGNGTGGDNSKSVCSTITLKLSQTMTMTRQAFRGTLTVFNGNETTAMRNVKLSLQVTNTATGQIATSHEFQVNAESLDGFTGALDLNSGWTLGGNSTGKATVLFIPTKYAAPTEPVEWSFGGTLSYLDPFTGLEVTRDLYPVTLTVKPSPELDLTYFMQRDVLGDDPLTDEVEPIVPAEFALLINNKGYGDATNVRMVTQQPEIIENEKGLLIDFELVSSQVNGGDATLSFGETIANDFGTIPAHSQMYAQWWLTSTLLGHFVDYKVQATHVTSYGNEDLSLLDQVSIHELIHSLEVDDPAQGSGDKPLRGFMVNDIADADDLPDMLYLTNSEVLPVAIAASAQAQKTSATTYTVTITPSLAGWNYGNIVDPTCGMSAIKSIVRQSDGKQISLQNFWQTDRTLRDGKDPLYENRIHFADNFASTTAETYLLTFDPLPEVILAVESVGGVPDENTVAFSPVEQLTVRFNKPIDASTFTPDDLTFVAQGTRQDTGLIGITTADNQTFTLDLKAQTEPCPNGYYTLTVQTAGITDQEGFPGKTGKQVGWIMYRGGLVQLLTSAWPLNAGRVGIDLGLNSPARRTAATDGNTAQYGSTVTLMATPAPGYAFANWTLNGEVVSTNPEYEVLALGDMNVVANFTKMSYRVEVGSADAEQGTVAGATTGIYEHGTTLRLKAVPQGDYGFKCWMVDGVRMEETTDELTVSVDKAMTVEAVFRLAYSDQTIVLAQGWNWVSTYLQDALDATLLAPYADRIVGQDAELFRDPQLGMVGSLSTFQPGQAYKIQAANSASHTVHGQLFDEVPTLSLQKGWNWMAYPCSEQASLAVMRNAEAGDVSASQEGFACFDGTTWEGSVSEMHPGVGYLYKSASTKQLSFVVEPSPARRAVLRAPAARGLATLYPNTMNIVARIFRDGVELPGDDCLIYAMTGDELRGVSHFVGHNHYLTVYGDQPVTITFLIEHIATGETFKAVQSLPFHSDVVGSPLSPFAIQIGAATGIAVFGNDSPHAAAVFTLDGRKVCDATDKAALLHLPKGVYIVGGRKVVIN